MTSVAAKMARPFTALGRWYNNAAQSRPVVTAVVTTGLKTSAADLFAQKVRRGERKKIGGPGGGAGVVDAAGACAPPPFCARVRPRPPPPAASHLRIVRERSLWALWQRTTRPPGVSAPSPPINKTTRSPPLPPHLLSRLSGHRKAGGGRLAAPHGVLHLWHLLPGRLPVLAVQHSGERGRKGGGARGTAERHLFPPLFFLARARSPSTSPTFSLSSPVLASSPACAPQSPPSLGTRASPP